MAKRCFDVIMVVLALIVLLPVGLVIVVIARFTGEGEVLFRQERIGKDLKIFELLKFATMLKDSPNIGTGTMSVRNDPRVFPFGRLLRATKANELPQLLNVLMGQMSIVGPRPLVRGHLESLPEDMVRRVYSVRPGLTGIGSIVFRDEERYLSRSPKGLKRCYREDIAPLKAELELWYVSKRSFALDAKIVLLTIWVILVPRSRLYRRMLSCDWGKADAVLGRCDLNEAG
jgi:lipopolysaccharide/colanic/teichoic acid biosynthesis glycosyltransferase